MIIHYRFSSYLDFLTWVNKYKIQLDEIRTVEISLEEVIN